MQCFFDTPGLMLDKSGYIHKDMKVRVESAWSSVNLYDVLIVIFDVDRHLTRSVTYPSFLFLILDWFFFNGNYFSYIGSAITIWKHLALPLYSPCVLRVAPFLCLFIEIQ